jgi:hypothetical protein
LHEQCDRKEKETLNKKRKHQERKKFETGVE